jgi:uncharacterized protein YciI
MKYVLLYSTPEELDMELVGAHFDDHRARWQVFQEAGTLLMIGPFADPRDGAMAVFTTAEAAEEFASADPFVVRGIVASWRVLPWNEALVPEA